MSCRRRGAAFLFETRPPCIRSFAQSTPSALRSAHSDMRLVCHRAWWNILGRTVQNRSKASQTLLPVRSFLAVVMTCWHPKLLSTHCVLADEERGEKRCSTTQTPPPHSAPPPPMWRCGLLSTTNSSPLYQIRSLNYPALALSTFFSLDKFFFAFYLFIVVSL